MLQHKRELFRIEIRRKQLENRFNKTRKLFFSSDYERLLERIKLEDLESLEIESEEQATQFAHCQLFAQLKDLVRSSKDRKILNGAFNLFQEFCFHAKESDIHLIADIMPQSLRIVEEISNELDHSALSLRMFTNIIAIFYNTLNHDQVVLLRSLYTLQKLCSIISTLLLLQNIPLSENGILISLSLLIRRNTAFNKNDLLVGIKIFNQFYAQSLEIAQKALDLMIQYVSRTHSNDYELLFTHGIIAKLDLTNAVLQDSTLKLLSVLSEKDNLDTQRLFSLYNIGYQLAWLLDSPKIEAREDSCFILSNLLQLHPQYTPLVTSELELMNSIQKMISQQVALNRQWEVWFLVKAIIQNGVIDTDLIEQLCLAFRENEVAIIDAIFIEIMIILIPHGSKQLIVKHNLQNKIMRLAESSNEQLAESAGILLGQ